MKTIKILAASALLVVTGQAFAGSIILNGQTQTLCENPTIDLDAGTITANTDCGGTGDPSPEVNLSVSSSLVEVGDTVAVSWNHTGSTRCNAIGTAPAWDPTNTNNNNPGQKTLTFNTEGTFSVDLSCFNDNGTTLASRQVTVSEPSTGGGGSGEGGTTSCGNPTIQTTTEDWESIYGSNWPEPNGTVQNLALPRNTALALRIDTADAAAVNASFGEFENAFHTGAQVGRVLQLSKCPGDLEVNTVPNECRTSITISSTFDWSIGDDGNSSTCDLDENTVYYLNIGFVYLGAPTVRTCDNLTCRTLLKSYWSP